MYRQEISAYDNAHVHSGSYSGRLDRVDTRPHVYVHSDEWVRINNAQATQYTFSGWVYSNSPQAQLFFFMNEDGESGYYTQVEYVETNVKNQWVYLEETVSVPANIDKLNLRIGFQHGSVGQSVWFDDVKIVRTGAGDGEILDEKNYYPFGLEHKGYNNVVNGVENNYKTYQGQEFTQELGLNIHEWKYRISDPAIGRFWQVDPLAESFMYNGVYNFSENRVVDAIELEGLEALVIHAAKDYHAVMNRAATSEERNSATLGVSILHPIAALNVGSVQRGGTNISSVSGRVARHVAENNNMSVGIGSERNAFRHALWSATMKNEFGEKASTRIGNAHEGVKAMSGLTVDFDLPLVQDGEYADSVVDVLNNEIGKNIADGLGEDASQIDIAKEVLGAQLNEGLWTSSVDNDGNISISRTPITQEQYDTAMEMLETMDSNGFNEKDLKSLQN